MIKSAPSEAPGTFRKRPVEIQALHWNGFNQAAMSRFLGMTPHSYDVRPGYHTVHIQTLEGEMTGRIGDWIIKGVVGEFYPCRGDIFTSTYEEVGDTP
jgi:hypothetical protein